MLAVGNSKCVTERAFIFVVCDTVGRWVSQYESKQYRQHVEGSPMKYPNAVTNVCVLGKVRS
jgi:hypothetical protein